MQKIKETVDSRYDYQKNKLDKACFEHDMAWYVTEHLILLKVQNMMNIKKGLPSMV